MTDPTPEGQTWVCRNGRPTARCVEDCPVAAGCGPVPPAPSSDTPSGERATLTPRQQAIEAILIRHQDHAFSFVARRIDALFTTPAPSSSPVGDRVPPVHLLLDIWQALGGDSEAFHPWWAADPSFPDRWAQIVSAVAGNISDLAADSNPPAGALLDIAIQFGAADRGEPTDG